MPWNQHLCNLRDALAGLYDDKADIRRVIQDTGLKPSFIDMNGKPMNVWQNILEETEKRRLVDELIKVARGDYPENPVLQRAAANLTLTDVRGEDIDADVTWRGEEDANTLEKIIGNQSTILPISFLSVGLECSKAVARIVRSDGSSGSGFLTKGNWLVTNHHVLKSADQARSAKAQFNVERSAEGRDLPAEEFGFAPDNGFQTSKGDDWTVVRLSDDANKKWGEIPLSRRSARKKSRVNIIQHPGGGPKAISLYHNIVTYADQSRVQYLTDTLPGSSGSPVFDSDWNVVAIHHSGGWLREPEMKELLFRNEGIAINKLLDGAGDPLGV